MQPSVSKDKFYKVSVTFNCKQKLNFKILKNLTLNDLYKKIKTIFFPDEEIELESDTLSSIMFKKISTNASGYNTEVYCNIKFYSKNTPLLHFVLQSQDKIDLEVNTDFR